MLYELALFFGSMVARLISLIDKKMARFFFLRKGEIERVAKYFNAHKDKNKKVFWFHSASAGEFEQAKPLIENFKSVNKNNRIIASFFSPSGYAAGLKYDKIDFCFNLPLDRKKNIDRLLRHIKPYMIIFSKYDVWTNLAIQSHKQGVKLALISATLPEQSMRHQFPFRIFFKKAYSLLDRIYAISRDDALRFNKITGSNDNIIISGDTRFDRVKTVISTYTGKPGKILLKEKGITYLVAGSTYKSSEKKLIPAVKQLNDKRINTRLILVPHEIDRNNIQRLEKLVVSYGFSPVLYSESSLPLKLKNNDIFIIDAFGVLALLYKEADMVFIGGSFKGSVHSILEPAVFGKPIFTGPHIGNAYEALAMKETGGLTLCNNSGELYAKVLELINNNKLREDISRKVISFFNDNTGASRFIINDMSRIVKL